MATERGRVRTPRRDRWTGASFLLSDGALRVSPDAASPTSWAPADIGSVTELAPFDGDPRSLEVVLTTGEVWLLELPSSSVDRWCAALRRSLDTPVVTTEGTSGTAAWWRVGLAAALLAGVVVTVTLGSDVGHRRPTRPAAAAAAPSSTSDTTDRSSTTSTSTSGTPASTSSSSTSSSTTAPPAAAVAPTTTLPAPPPVPMAVAPLTGLSVPAVGLMRNAIVSKIDGSAPAMPQVGLDQADMVLEVKIEWGLSRYLAVFHSQQPTVIGPHRSARTTDPDLLAMFGHPLFAFSGANPGVVDRLALTDWKTGVGPGEVPRAWFRDETRPYPHNLFAATEVLRSRPAPVALPAPRFFFRPPGTGGGGVPVEGMAVSVGATPLFRWDPALGGWRRWIHDRDHLHASGAPVAPTNVVVVETFYGVSAADGNSPEAISLGVGRAWVFTDGHMVAGSWTRLDRYAPYDLRDAAGNPITLLPGSTWVALADREPFIDPVG
jgi:hypothetical protein